jgi:type II secretory pathway pseudopilin PulG
VVTVRARFHARWRDERGITLVEMLVVIMILVVVVTGVSVLMASAIGADADLSRRVEAQNQARLALDRLRQDVHCASSVDIDPGWTDSVTLTLPVGCYSGDGAITWCTRQAGNRWTLHRARGDAADCAGGGELIAAHLNRGDTFSYEFPGVRRGTLTAVLPVHIEHARSHRPYELEDRLVFRNSM